MQFNIVEDRTQYSVRDDALSPALKSPGSSANVTSSYAARGLPTISESYPTQGIKRRGLESVKVKDDDMSQFIRHIIENVSLDHRGVDDRRITLERIQVKRKKEVEERKLCGDLTTPSMRQLGSASLCVPSTIEYLSLRLQYLWCCSEGWGC